MQVCCAVLWRAVQCSWGLCTQLRAADVWLRDIMPYVHTPRLCTRTQRGSLPLLRHTHTHAKDTPAVYCGAAVNSSEPLLHELKQNNCCTACLAYPALLVP